VQCSNQIFDEQGNHITGGIEYETVALVGANCDVTDYDDIIMMDRLCDDFGIDTIETGNTIAMCMEGGKIPWGDGKAAIGLIHEMMKGSEFGRLLGSGAEATGLHFGVKRIPVAKHQGMGGYDVRGAVLTGVAYATSAQGADHTLCPLAGTCEGMPQEEVIKVDKNVQTMFAMNDSICCGFAWIFWGKQQEKVAALYAALYGGTPSMDRLMRLGALTLKCEKEFNIGAGWKPEDDILPEFFYQDKSEVTGITFPIPQEIMAKTFAEI